MWIAKVKADYEKAGGEEAECNKTTVKEIPEKVETPKEEKKEAPKKEAPKKENVKPAAVETSVSKPMEPTPKEKAEVVIEEGNVSITQTA